MDLQRLDEAIQRLETTLEKCSKWGFTAGNSLAVVMEFRDSWDARYAGGFPITLEAMVEHARAQGRLDDLHRLITDPPAEED